MADKDYQKSFSFQFLKQEGEQLPIGDGIPVTDSDLAKINKLAPKILKKEDLFVGVFVGAHNIVDRDGERIKESLLIDLARTVPGKNHLKHHDTKKDPMGLVFDADIQKMSLEAFRALVGNEIGEIRGTDSPEVLFLKSFLLKEDGNLSDRKKLDSGIFRHASMRFRASDIEFVDDVHGGFIEISGPGEATEFSTVWLGSQPGTGIKEAKQNGDTKKMDKGLEKLKEFLGSIREIIGEAVTEENVTEKIKSVLAKSRDRVKELTTKNTELEEKVKELTPMADYGKAYRDSSEAEIIRFKALLGDVGNTSEEQAQEKIFLKEMSMDFVLKELKILEKRVHEKCPSESQFLKTEDPKKPGEFKKEDKNADEFDKED